MSGYCEVCSMAHDVCSKCGAAIVASLYLHREMNAHGSGPHWCGADNPGYVAMVAAMRMETDGAREMLTECPKCQDDVVRRASSPVLYDAHGFYGLQGESAVHQCAEVTSAPASTQEPPAAIHEERQPAAPRLRLL